MQGLHLSKIVCRIALRYVDREVVKSCCAYPKELTTIYGHLNSPTIHLQQHYRGDDSRHLDCLLRFKKL